MFDYLFTLPFPVPVAAMPPAGLWKLTLVDGRTGRPMLIGGEVFAAYTRDPERTEAELMHGRDPLTWMCRAEPVDTFQ
jgi:hypothetical protein